MNYQERLYQTPSSYEVNIILGLTSKLYFNAAQPLPPEEFALIKSIFSSLMGKHLTENYIRVFAQAVKACVVSDIEVNFENLSKASKDFNKVCCKDRDSFFAIVANQIYPTFEDIQLFRQAMVHKDTNDSPVPIIDLILQGNLINANPELKETLTKIQESLDLFKKEDPLTLFDYKSGKDLVDEYEVVEARRESGEGFYTCGYKDIDKYFVEGFAPKKVTIIAGRPGMGKSAFAMCLMKNLAAQKVHVVESVLEMNNISFLDRYLSATSLIPMEKLIKNREMLTESDRFQLNIAKNRLLSNSYLHLNDTPGPTIENIRTAILRLQEKIGQKYMVLFIDLFDKVKNLLGNPNNMTANFHLNLNAIQSLGKELDVHFVLVAQINRDTEKRQSSRPKMADLKHSGAFEEVADIILFVDRPSYRIMEEESQEMEDEGGYVSLSAPLDYESLDNFIEKNNNIFYNPSKDRNTIPDVDLNDMNNGISRKGDIDDILKEKKMVKVGSIVLPISEYAEIILAKQRSGPGNKIIPFIFKGEMSLFTSVSLVSPFTSS